MALEDRLAFRNCDLRLPSMVSVSLLSNVFLPYC
jgi:hypothetical protein